MTTTLALSKLYEDVQAVFAADGVTGIHWAFGWREPPKQTATAAKAGRILFVPGDSSGNLGKDAPAKWPGRNPRPLATLLELCTVEIWAHDGSRAENEQAQYEAARNLYDTWRRAMHIAAHGTFTIQSARWLITKTERRFGAELEIVLQLQAAVLDAASAEPSPITSETSNSAGMPAGDEPDDVDTTAGEP